MGVALDPEGISGWRRGSRQFLHSRYHGVGAIVVRARDRAGVDYPGECGIRPILLARLRLSEFLSVLFPQCAFAASRYARGGSVGRRGIAHGLRRVPGKGAVPGLPALPAGSELGRFEKKPEQESEPALGSEPGG